jgi:hypothetical protein
MRTSTTVRMREKGKKGKNRETGRVFYHMLGW